MGNQRPLSTATPRIGSQEDALRAAFAAIKEEEVRSAKENAGAGGFESIALRSASKLSYELRAFTLGVQESLARVVQLATNRALLDSKVAIKSAEYLLRRAIFDSGRVLAAGRVALALGAAPTDADRKAQAEVSPFAARLSKINNVRQLGRASTESQRALGAAIEEEEKTREQLLAEKAAAEEALRREAADLLREAIGGIEEWVREARRREEQRSKQERQDVNTSNGAAATPSRGPNWLRLQQRARVVGGELGAALSISLEELRSDFSAYVELDAQGQLPTLVEEAEDAAAAATGSLRGGGIGSVLNNGMLGGLSVGDDSSKRRERAARLETDLEIKKAKLAATVASRASKDVSDAAVYGVLPTAKAISKVAAQRAAEKIASTMGSAVGSKPRQGVSRSRESPEGSGNFLRDVASQIADEYKRDIERGAKYGPLADAADVFKGPTKAIKKDLEDVAALGLSALNGLLAPSPSATNASTQVLEDFDASRRGTLVDGEADRTDRITRSVGEQTPAVDLSTMEQATQHAPSAPSRQQKVASPPPAPRALEVEVIEVESFVVEARASYTEDIDIPEDETTKMDGGSRTLPEPSGGSRGMGTRIAGAGEEFDIGSGIVVQTRTRDAKTSGVDDVREASDDALDIDVSAQVEEDVEEVRNERRAKVLDASLVLLELGVQRVGTILGRVMTTEEGRSWELLQSLQERDKTKMARSAKATAALLEEIINLVGRK